jgi:hypothetical protein
VIIKWTGYVACMTEQNAYEVLIRKPEHWNPLTWIRHRWKYRRPPLWSSGQSSWLHIQRPGFDSLRCQIFWEVMCLGTGSTQPREYNWGATWKKKVKETKNTAVEDPLCWPRGTLYQQKLALTPPISCGISVGMVRSRTKATKFVLVCLFGSTGTLLKYFFIEVGFLLCGFD